MKYDDPVKKLFFLNEFKSEEKRQDNDLPPGRKTPPDKELNNRRLRPCSTRTLARFNLSIRLRYARNSIMHWKTIKHGQ